MTENNILETFIQQSSPTSIGEEDLKSPLIIGASQKVESLEKFLPAPLRIKESRAFDDLRGFVEYAKSFKGDASVAFASRERIQIIFDYHFKEQAAWGSHSITYAYRRSARWNIWAQNNNQWKSQEDFADFLDTGLNEIAEPTQSAVLDLVKDFRATRNATVESQIGADGTNFVYRQQTKGGARKTDITIPEFLKVQVAPFDGLQVLNAYIADEKKQIPVYDFKAKLTWRLKDTGDEETRPQFKIQLLNFEQAIDETLEAVRVALQDLTGIQTYIGG